MSSTCYYKPYRPFLMICLSAMTTLSFGCASEAQTRTAIKSIHTNTSATKILAATNEPTEMSKPRKVIVELEKSNQLQQLIDAAPGSIIVDFYADWCPPCRRQSAILHEMESDLRQQNVTVIKVNVDKHRELASQLQVSSLPTLMVVKDGKLTKRQSGMATQERLAQWLAPARR